MELLLIIVVLFLLFGGGRILWSPSRLIGETVFAVSDKVVEIAI